MTVSYSNEIASTSAMGVFWKLLGRWKGSIYKLIWREVLVFCTAYYIIKLLYSYAFTTYGQEIFNSVVKYCRFYSTSIPLSFVLGFYVNLVMERWWNQYKSLPWPDTLGVQVSSLVEGMDERSRMMRRSVMRYVNVSYVMALGIVSPRVNLRFPDLESLVEAGFLEPSEKEIIVKLAGDDPVNKFYWLPLIWASTILTRAKKEKLIKDDFGLKTMLDSITDFRSGLASLMGYHSISIPLVYTQVVTLAVYSFFAGSLVSSQYITTDAVNTKYPQDDLIIPYFTLLQYLFYVGWLKVAETLVNPFGTDDDDFELNVLIDRNFQVSYLIVDTMHEKYPTLVHDRYWSEQIPANLAAKPIAELIQAKEARDAKEARNQDQHRRSSMHKFKEGASPYLSQVRNAFTGSILKRENSKPFNESSQKFLPSDQSTLKANDYPTTITISTPNDKTDGTNEDSTRLLRPLWSVPKEDKKDDFPYADDEDKF